MHCGTTVVCVHTWSEGMNIKGGGVDIIKCCGWL